MCLSVYTSSCLPVCLTLSEPVPCCLANCTHEQSKTDVNHKQINVCKGGSGCMLFCCKCVCIDFLLACLSGSVFVCIHAHMSTLLPVCLTLSEPVPCCLVNCTHEQSKTDVNHKQMFARGVVHGCMLFCCKCVCIDFLLVCLSGSVFVCFHAHMSTLLPVCLSLSEPVPCCLVNCTHEQSKTDVNHKQMFARGVVVACYSAASVG